MTVREVSGLSVSRVRVAVANEPVSYREAIAEVLRSLCPTAEIFQIEPEDLDRVVRTVGLDVVLCSHLTSAVESLVPAWVLLYPDYEPLVMICTDGEVSTVNDINLGELVSLIARVQAGLNTDGEGTS
jgi:hypothetical protein